MVITRKSESRNFTPWHFTAIFMHEVVTIILFDEIIVFNVSVDMGTWCMGAHVCFKINL